MHKQLLKILSLLPVIFISSLSYATEPTTNLFSVGSYNTWGGSNMPRYPWIITSSDQGQSWSYLNDKPDNSVYMADLLSSSCNDENCVAVGYYTYINSVVADKYPAVTLSHDGGKTWAYPSLQSTRLLAKTFPNEVSCNNQICAMTGVDENGTYMSSMLAVSKDNGSTWSYPKISNLPWDYNSRDSLLDKIDCSTGNCIALGLYRKPFLIVGTDKGNKWSYQNIPFTVEPIASELKSIKCHDSTCVIGGHYQGVYYNYPFLLKSTDKGASWSVIKFPNDVKGGINNIDCQGNECLASGGFYINKDTYHVAVSHDGGLTWNYPKIKSPDFNELNEVLYLIDINKDNYLVAGIEKRELGCMPILVMSKDQGKTWAYIKSIAPDDVTDGHLSALSCKNNVCLATGDYGRFATQPTCSSCPYLKISYNYGQDWMMPADVLSKMPEDYMMNGMFRSLPVFNDHTNLKKLITAMKP